MHPHYRLNWEPRATQTQMYFSKSSTRSLSSVDRAEHSQPLTRLLLSMSSGVGAPDHCPFVHQCQIFRLLATRLLVAGGLLFAVRLTSIIVFPKIFDRNLPDAVSRFVIPTHLSRPQRSSRNTPNRFRRRAIQQRPDCVVHDEPLYAHFLRTHPEDETWRPYRDQVFKEQVNVAPGSNSLCLSRPAGRGEGRAGEGWGAR